MLPRIEFILVATEKELQVTQSVKDLRSTEYAIRSDFCRIYVEQMNSLYLLSLLLTADPQEAEQCFLSGFEDSVSSTYVFKESAHLWARRSIILNAIRLLRPRPNGETKSDKGRLLLLNRSLPAAAQPYPNYARIVPLNSFERFIFVMSILEEYTVHECSILMGCLRRDVIDARIAAIYGLGSRAIAAETESKRDVNSFCRSELRKSLAMTAQTCREVLG